MNVIRNQKDRNVNEMNFNSANETENHHVQRHDYQQIDNELFVQRMYFQDYPNVFHSKIIENIVKVNISLLLLESNV